MDDLRGVGKEKAKSKGGGVIAVEREKERPCPRIKGVIGLTS